MREQLKDRNRLQHIVEATDIILDRTKGLTRERLTEDKVFFYGIVYQTLVIGEAAYKLTKAFRKAHPETPWIQIAKMRHNLVHGYYQIDPNIVWSVIRDDLKTLREQVARYLDEVNWEEWENDVAVIKETAINKNLEQTARRMKARGYSIEEIADITGLPANDIEML